MQCFAVALQHVNESSVHSFIHLFIHPLHGSKQVLSFVQKRFMYFACLLLPQLNFNNTISIVEYGTSITI